MYNWHERNTEVDYMFDAGTHQIEIEMKRA